MLKRVQHDGFANIGLGTSPPPLLIQHLFQHLDKHLGILRAGDHVFSLDDEGGDASDILVLPIGDLGIDDGGEAATRQSDTVFAPINGNSRNFHYNIF